MRLQRRINNRFSKPLRTRRFTRRNTGHQVRYGLPSSYPIRKLPPGTGGYKSPPFIPYNHPKIKKPNVSCGKNVRYANPTRFIKKPIKSVAPENLIKVANPSKGNSAVANTSTFGTITNKLKSVAPERFKKHITQKRVELGSIALAMLVVYKIAKK